MNTKTLRTACLSFCACLLAALASAAPFVSPHGYTLTPPAGWQVDHTSMPDNDVTIFAGTGSPGDILRAIFGIKIVPSSSSLTLESFKPLMARELHESFPRATIVSQTYSSVGGVRALDTTFTHSKNGGLVRDRQLVVLKNRSVYFFSAVCTDKLHTKYDPLFAQMVSSVRWKS